MYKRCACWVIVAFLAMGLGCSTGDPPAADASNVAGFKDFSFGTDFAEDPIGEPNQSKLWFNDGIWWGVLFDDDAGEFRVHRYDWDTNAWADTGTTVDERDSSRADVLWDGAHLYVVSVGPEGADAVDGAGVARYGYDPATDSYSLDPGFPVTITGGGAKTITLAKDTADRLWVTYTWDDRIYVTHSLQNDLAWKDPFPLPTRGTSVTRDDTPAIVAFGSQIGVLWSNHPDDAFYFATHSDGDPADSWRTTTVIQGSGIADDGISLKADSSGNVFAAVKTSLNDGPDPDSDAPLIFLLVRNPDGGWDRHVFGRVADNHTRPTVLLDEEHQNLYVFATNRCCRGGRIYYKRTRMDDISFSEGEGSPFVRSATDKHVNNVTSTKQVLDGTTKLLVESADAKSGYYWHNSINLSDTTLPTKQPR